MKMKNRRNRLISILLTALLFLTCTSFGTAAGVILLGDTDGNGKVDSSDALNVLRYSVGLIKEIDVKTADTNKDGQINSADALDILQTAVGLKETVPAEEPDTPDIKSKAQIIECYNTAVNKAVSSGAGYSKSRTTSLEKLEGAESLMKIQVARDAVYSFLGVGELEYVNPKGKSEFMSPAELTESEVQSASFTDNDGTCTIRLTLADGKSEAPADTDTSPLRHSGLFTGSDDKPEYDYKNARNIYAGLNNVENASVEKVSEETKNAVITADIDSATGNLKSLSISFDWDARLTNIKYSFFKVSGTGIVKTTVEFKDFNW